MANVLVTGGGRGIGLELARQLLEQQSSRIARVFITIRSKSDKAEALLSSHQDRLTFLECRDITDPATVRQLAVELDKKLGDKGLDILINNIGRTLFSPDGIESLTGSDLTQVFNTNVVSAHMMTSALLPALRRGKEKKVVNISTTVGSITNAKRFRSLPSYAYKITKAALNMLTVQYAFDLEKEGFTILAVSPGWLKTDLGSQHADLEVSVGVSAAKDIILNATTEKNGKFCNIHVPGWEDAPGPNQYEGEEHAW